MAAFATRVDMMSWANGYLSSYNHHVVGVYDIYGHTDGTGIESWLFNYCLNNPLRNFDEAVDALIVQLYPSRLTVAPRCPWAQSA